MNNILIGEEYGLIGAIVSGLLGLVVWIIKANNAHSKDTLDLLKKQHEDHTVERKDWSEAINRRAEISDRKAVDLNKNLTELVLEIRNIKRRRKGE